MDGASAVKCCRWSTRKVARKIKSNQSNSWRYLASSHRCLQNRRWVLRERRSRMVMEHVLQSQCMTAKTQKRIGLSSLEVQTTTKDYWMNGAKKDVILCMPCSLCIQQRKSRQLSIRSSIHVEKSAKLSHQNAGSPLSCSTSSLADKLKLTFYIGILALVQRPYR